MHRLPLRKFHRWRVHLLWVVIVSAGPASASPEVLELTWPDVVRLAEGHPRLAADQLQVAAARSGIAGAGAVTNPTFEADLGRGRARIGDEARSESELALSIPLGWIAERGPKLEAARAEVDVALAESLASRREVLLRLRTLFWGLAYEQARVGVLETLVAQTTKLARTVRRRVETGEVRPVEAPLVEIELEKVAAELEAAETILRARQSALARWLAVPSGRALVAKVDLSALPVVLDREVALERARSADPALRIASARSRLLSAGVRAERRATIPAFSLRGFVTDELDRRAHGVGISFDVPIWSWNRGRIAQAEAKLAAADRQAEATALEVETTLIEAQAACRASVATARRLRDEIVPRSESVVLTMERTYEVGEANLLPMIDARRTLLDSRRLSLNALAQAQLDCSRLDALAGEETP